MDIFGMLLKDQLKHHLAFMRMVLASVGEAICAIDRHCEIISVNPALLEMLGLTEQEVVGKRGNAVFGGTSLGHALTAA